MAQVCFFEEGRCGYCCVRRLWWACAWRRRKAAGAAVEVAEAAGEAAAAEGALASTREFLGLGWSRAGRGSRQKGRAPLQANCGACHGERARGAQAPNLVRSVVVLHDEKGEEIGPVIKNGRPQAGMPAFPSLSSDDIHNIGQYLKLQVELAANRGTYGATYAATRNQTSGDPRRAKRSSPETARAATR